MNFERLIYNFCVVVCEFTLLAHMGTHGMFNYMHVSQIVVSLMLSGRREERSKTLRTWTTLTLKKVG